MISLMNKYIDMRKHKKRCDVKSVIFTSPGIVYVESFTEAAVKELVVGIQDLWGWRPGSIVKQATADMVKIVQVPERPPLPKPGEWVRVRTGQYKDDLAQVVGQLQDSEKIIIKMVPRINYPTLHLTAEQRKLRGRSARPLMRLYSKADVETALGDNFGESKWVVNTNTTNWGLAGLHYFNGGYYEEESGLMLKEVRASQVTVNGPPPTTMELKWFKMVCLYVYVPLCVSSRLYVLCVLALCAHLSPPPSPIFRTRTPRS